MMPRRSPLALIPALLALSVVLAGCSKDKGTNPTQVTEPFESGDLLNGAVFVHTFPNAGSFSYRCRIHPMMGVVNVVASAPDDSAIVPIQDFSFGPASIKPGGYVKWENQGTTHTVTRP